jgi:5,10-methylenetetrahydromethanopterin reductase
VVELSLGLFPTEPPGRLVELICLAEELGYACVYVGDSQMIWREAFVILGAAARATAHIRLATGVSNPITRDPAVLAAGIETLRELAGPRVVLGIGTGDSSLETLGKRPATLAKLEASIELVRGLLAGREVQHPDSGVPVRLTYVPPGEPPPVYVAVSSPRIHRLAGRVADGAIVLVGTDPGFLAASRRELTAGQAEAAERQRAAGSTAGAPGTGNAANAPQRFRVVCWTPCSVGDDGWAARASVKAHVARVLKRRLPFALDPATQAVVEEVRARYAYYEHMVPGTPHGDVVPDDLVERFAIAGSPSEARAQLQRLAAAGLVDEIALIPHAAQPADRERIIHEVAAMSPSLQS